jgi:hypothetical protein
MIALQSIISTHTSVGDEEIEGVLGHLTYGGADIRSPDIALQPLVELNDGRVCWSPHMILDSSQGRNLLVLLNRTPQGRDAYSRLSDHREAMLRDSLVSDLGPLGFRSWHGNVPAWGASSDVDLAIISDEEKCCLFLELKSLISPAEPREIKDKSADIKRGINQVRKRPLHRPEVRRYLEQQLSIDDDYTLSWAVASETTIGGAWIQEDDVPVVQARHLMRKLRTEGSLAVTSNWLSCGSHLPTEGVDYDVVITDTEIAGYILQWHAIRCITDDYI